MVEWVISPEDSAAYLDLRGDELTFGDAERMLETIQPYYPSRQLTRIVIDVRDLDPLPGPVEVLVVGIEAQAQNHGLQLEVLRTESVS
ncbi:MAG: hypothetical protein M3O88_08955 [Actinomycetota bacterium]|nr:hypothetical protein [Actinomycetota bacterium]